MRLPRVFLTLLLSLLAAVAHAQTPRDFAVDVSATVSDAVPRIVLNWTQRRQSNITAQKIYRRLKGEVTWNLLATIGNTDTSYSDTTALAGVEYEYWMQRTFTGISPSIAMGYLSAGVKVPMVDARGTLLLLIDDTMTAPLAPEIAQLQQDLAADGWTVQTITAPRAGTVPATKALIQSAYNADPANVKMVYLLGHVPVPYSGVIVPDGHGNHVGAWPADGYYGDMDGTWTDTTANNITASDPRNQNIPGDGKFDQSTLPSLMELAVGRVDLHSMQRAPSTAVTETSLLRRYLKKAHDFRFKLGAYVGIPRRALVRDGFGYFGGENFATSGFAWAFSGSGSVIDEPPSGQWFTYATSSSYLIGYGCGGGSYESAGSVGTTTNFGRLPSKVVFVSLFGSYHGDWDVANNFMRSVLAGTGTGDSLGLTCFWAGRPHYFMYPMGMGEPLGFSIRHSQNGGLATYSNPTLTPGGSSYRGVHTGLMGDPALRLHAVAPPASVSATSASGQVSLGWAPPIESGVEGYHVFRAATPAGPFTRLTTSALTTTSYTDTDVTVGQSYSYLVRTLKLETAPGGSYYNLSLGTPVTLAVSSGATPRPKNPTSLAVNLVGASAALTWVDNASDETSYRIEKKINAGGAWSTFATLGANVSSATDVGPFSKGALYSYRVLAVGAAGNSPTSNEVLFEAVAGSFELSSGIATVNKTDGNAVMTVTRFGGSVGAASVKYATANSSASAGTHYTNSSGTLNWADGETGPKTFNVPITNTASPQLPRQFKVSLNSPSSGTAIAATASTAVLIEDPAASLPGTWQQTVLGSLTDSAPAVEAEGAIGSTTIGGSGVTSASTSEAGQFVYQGRTGDGSMTVYIPAPTPAQSSARYAVMVRESGTSTSPMAAAVASSDTGTFGAKLVYRTTTSGSASELPSTANGFGMPRWLRLTRAGNSFTAEASANGTVWTLLGNATVPLPSTAFWGVFHYSAGLSSTTGLGDYQLAEFRNISLGGLPLPEAPGTLAATYITSAAPYVNVTWTAPAYANAYRLERRVEGGVFAQIATPAAGAVSYQDPAIAGDTSYEYRLIAANASGDGPWSNLARITTPPADTVVSLPAAGANGADATLRYDTPAGTFGMQDSLTISGSDIVSGALTPVAKMWLRFDLSGFAGVKSANLKLTLLSHDLQPTFTGGDYFYSYIRMLSEASDTWTEAAINWSNAPQNDTAGLLTTGTILSLGTIGFFDITEVPPIGTVMSLPLTVTTLMNNVGANNLATFAIVPYGQCGPLTFASGEHATAAPPALELIFTSALTKPSALVATPGGASGINLAWLDNSTLEAGYRIERRAIGGTFTTLQDVAASTVAFADATTLPGVIYEYRVRATGIPADSSWSAIASATAPGTATAYQLWLQSHGLPMDGSGPGDPDAKPLADGLSNFLKYVLGLDPGVAGSGSRLADGTTSVAGSEYLTLTFTIPDPPRPGVLSAVEASDSLTPASWSSAGLVTIGDSVNAGLRTVTVRDNVPIAPGSKRFLRFNATQQ